MNTFQNILHIGLKFWTLQWESVGTIKHFLIPLSGHEFYFSLFLFFIFLFYKKKIGKQENIINSAYLGISLSLYYP